MSSELQSRYFIVTFQIFLVILVKTSLSPGYGLGYGGYGLGYGLGYRGYSYGGHLWKRDAEAEPSIGYYGGKCVQLIHQYI